MMEVMSFAKAILYNMSILYVYTVYISTKGIRVCADTNTICSKMCSKFVFNDNF